MALKSHDIEDRIERIRKHCDPHSNLFGRLLNWSDGFMWRYGIGLSGTYIFDTGQGLRVFRFTNTPKLVMGVDDQLFSPTQTIERLVHALRVFRHWDYGLLGWNCEHFARLVAHNDPISYEVLKLPWPIPLLNHNGRHPTARDDLRKHLQMTHPELVTVQVG